MSLLPGVNRLEALIEAQNAATEQHRAFEGETLRTLEGKAKAIEEEVAKTNSTVSKHTIELAVIKEAERQALIVEAAKVKAEGEAKAARIEVAAAKRSWKQNLVMVAAGPVGLVVGYLVLGWIEHGHL